MLLALGYHQSQVEHGVAQYAHEAGWVLNTQMAHYGIIPDHWTGDGIITFLVTKRPDITDYVKKANVPTVDISADVQIDIPIAHVVLDNYKIGKLAAEHLIERNFKNLAFYQFINSYDILNRLAGFQDTVQSHGRNFYLLNWYKSSQKQPRQKAFRWLELELAKLPRPLGLCTQSDNRAVDVFGVCENLGIVIPEDLALIGIENDQIVCNLASVPLSSVDPDRFGQGYNAAKLLDQIINSGNFPPEMIIHPPKSVIIRKSTDIYAIDNPDIAKAIGFIWEHFRQPITAEHVIQSSNLSRAEFYRIFQKHIGHSVGKEITRKRLELAKKMLLETNHKLNYIANQCGLSDGRHLIRVFQREINTTPSQYRQTGKFQVTE